METFALQDPDRDSTAAPAAGVCQVDTMTTTSPSGRSTPTLCGLEAGQHMYIDAGTGATDTSTVTFALNAAGTATSADRLWSIKVSQIPCDEGYEAPTGCLQYYTGLSGQVWSFNFLNSANPQYLVGTYDVCIRKEAGYCSVCWQESSSTNSFKTDTTAAIGTSTTANCDAAKARVFIFNSSVGGTGTPQDVYCGGALNPAMLCTSSSNKLTIDFVSPATGAAGSGDAQRGICLDYRQVPC